MYIYIRFEYFVVNASNKNGNVKNMFVLYGLIYIRLTMTVYFLIIL